MPMSMRALRNYKKMQKSQASEMLFCPQMVTILFLSSVGIFPIEEQEKCYMYIALFLSMLKRAILVSV